MADTFLSSQQVCNQASNETLRTIRGTSDRTITTVLHTVHVAPQTIRDARMLSGNDDGEAESFFGPFARFDHPVQGDAGI